MIKIKIESNNFKNILQSHKNIKKEYDETIKNIATELLRKAYGKYFARNFLFYHCPNIMKKRRKK